MSQEAILIGGGYSLKEQASSPEFWDKIKKQEVWSLNFAYKLMPYLPKKQLWVDATFFRNNMKDLEALSKQGVEMYAKSNLQYVNLKAINQFDVFRLPKEIAKFPNGLFGGQMGLVGFFAISLAIKLGYKTLYCCGYDFGTPSHSDKKTHWYQEQVKDKGINSYGIENTQIYLQPNDVPNPMIQDFEYYLQFPVKIYNVSSKEPSGRYRTNISYFEIISYEEFLNKIAGV